MLEASSNLYRVEAHQEGQGVGALTKLTRSKHGVQEKHPSTGNILRQLVIKELGRRSFLVTLDQDLADTN